MSQFTQYVFSQSELAKMDEEFRIENMWVDKYSPMELYELQIEKQQIKNSGIVDKIRTEVLESMIENFQ